MGVVRRDVGVVRHDLGVVGKDLGVVKLTSVFDPSPRFDVKVTRPQEGIL